MEGIDIQPRELVVGAMAAGTVSLSQAYQTDFHFGMTYWLGLQVGLTADESFRLASGNDWKDAGMLDARPIVAYSICIKKDPTAFQLAREHHFRSIEENPAPPIARQVLPGVPYATEKVNKLTGKVRANSLNGPADASGHRIRGEQGQVC